MNAADFARHPNLPLLLDPQTSGGLLAAVPPAVAWNSALAAAGFRSTSQSADPAYTAGLPPSQICG